MKINKILIFGSEILMMFGIKKLWVHKGGMSNKFEKYVLYLYCWHSAVIDMRIIQIEIFCREKLKLA